MTPTVPLPPSRDVWTSCAQAYQAWTEGRIRWDSLIDGAVVLADGTRCPIEAGQPDLARTGMGAWTAIGAGCLLIIVGILALIVKERRQRDMNGRHHWLEEGDMDPNGGGDAELLAAVTGLGERREPDEQARAAAEEMPDDWPDLRGARDRDPQAPNPWRSR